MAEFTPVDIDHAREFLRKHHWGILATRRKNGTLQMSPVTVGLDAQGRTVISSRETAYKVNNLRRDSRAALCAITSSFHGEGWVQINGSAEIVSLPDASTLWSTSSVRSMASTRAGRNFMREWRARGASSFALQSILPDRRFAANGVYPYSQSIER